MPPTVRGFVYGTLGCAGLYVLLVAAGGTKAQSERVTGLFAFPAEFLQRFIDPTIPALHKGAGKPKSSLQKALPGGSLLTGLFAQAIDLPLVSDLGHLLGIG